MRAHLRNQTTNISDKAREQGYPSRVDEPPSVAHSGRLDDRAIAILGWVANEPPCSFELERETHLRDFSLGRFTFEVAVVQASQSSQEGSTSAAP